MSLPNYLAKIKSSGVYRFTWDKSVVPPQQAETLRLVVGYSEKGPFNTPVYVESVSDFKSIYGNISKRLERRGSYFHRMAEQALQAGPILAFNIKPFEGETVSFSNFNGCSIENVDSVAVEQLYDTDRFWNLDADKMIENLELGGDNANYITLAATDTKDMSCSVVMRPIVNNSYKGITVRSWCASQGVEPVGYMEHILDEPLEQFFAEIYVFRGQFNNANSTLSKYIAADGGVKASYKNNMGHEVDALEGLSKDPNSNFIGMYSGCLLPYFKDANGNYISLDLKFNSDHNNHKMLMKLNSELLDSAESLDDVKGMLLGEVQEPVEPTAGTLEGDSEVGVYSITYFPGYTYSTIGKNDLLWEKCKEILSKDGIYEALTNRVDVEYHYIIDTFDTLPGENKSELFSLAKAKDNAFSIVNFPKMSKFLKDKNGLQDAMNNYTLPGDSEGASFGAYYTQLTFSDGTVKTVAPSAALVSNNFMQKWGPRQPYYIVAGPNYGTLTYSGLIGPDYNYGRNDLDILEPAGVNAIIYVPRLGTYISSNQTAKQIPISGLSKIHIRELVIFLQNEIEHLLQTYQWELNTQTLRDIIKSKADAICDKIMNNGGIYAYTNICNETNNTPEVIDNEMIILDTEIEPARGAGKMVHQLTIHKTGGLTSSIK